MPKRSCGLLSRSSVTTKSTTTLRLALGICEINRVGHIMGNYDEIKEECYQANLLLPEFKLIDLTFGNVSVAEPGRRVFAIKPSGVDYNTMKADDMVVGDFGEKIIEGSLRPASDTPKHCR